jgi:hypothetical protein
VPFRLERSDGSRLAVDYAARIRAGEFPGDPEAGLRDHWPIARRLRDGPPLPHLIAVRDVRRPDFLVLVGSEHQPGRLAPPQADFRPTQQCLGSCSAWAGLMCGEGLIVFFAPKRARHLSV